MTHCFDGKVTVSDQQTVQHILNPINIEKSPLCGVQYSFKMKISSDSQKTAGEIVLTFGDEIIHLTG